MADSIVYVDLKNRVMSPSSSQESDYSLLANKPSIEGVTLIGDKTFPDLNLIEEDNETINETFKKVFG